MKTYCIVRHELIESFGFVEAENEADARGKWESGSVDMELADDTTERGSILVYEEKPGETGPEPPQLDSVTKLQERVRILREVASQVVLEDEQNPGRIPSDIVTGARAALEAIKEGE